MTTMWPAKFVSACLCSGVLVSAVFIMLVPLTAHAGGSVDFEHDALLLLRKHPALLRFVQKTLDVSPEGMGFLFGAHGVQPERAGETIPPFQFLAKPKGQNGPYTLRLIFNDPDIGAYANGDGVVPYVKLIPLSPGESR